MGTNEPPEDVDSAQIQQIMRRVLEAERGKLHMGNPLGINDELQDIIEEEVD